MDPAVTADRSSSSSSIPSTPVLSPVGAPSTPVISPTQHITAEPHRPPLRVLVCGGDGDTAWMIREDASNNNNVRSGVSAEIRQPNASVKRRNIFVVDTLTLSKSEGFLLRNVKSHQCIGCVQRSGHLVSALFPYSVNRARELVWEKRESKLYNVFHEMFLGEQLPVTSREHVKGLLRMVELPSEALDIRFVPVPTSWSFNTSAKFAITATPEGALITQPRSMFSWAPYFDFVPTEEDSKRFYLKASRPQDPEVQWVKVTANGRCELRSRNPDVFYLVKTLKPNFFHVCTGRMYMATAEGSNAVTLSKFPERALSLHLSDAKQVEHRSLVGPELTSLATPAWHSVVGELKHLAKHPISMPVFAGVPKVLEREMSALASLYFIAQENEPESVRLLLLNEGLSFMERLLLANCRNACAMALSLKDKESKLFQALDQEIQAAKLAVSSAEKLFQQHATALPHVSHLRFHRSDSAVRVALLGDFGSGLKKNKELLGAIFKSDRPDVFIHLGDVYKRGSKREQMENLIEPLLECLQRNPGPPVSVFAVCGNHDLMARGGAGYYWALKEMASRGLSEQDASFFAIHIGDHFTIIGLDTSIEGLKFDSDTLYTRLGTEQLAWLQTRMEECRMQNRKVVLLTHHPVLSCGPKYPLAEPQHQLGVNEFLWNQLAPYFDIVHLFLWGHEHSFRVYEPFERNGRTLLRGRLCGHGTKYKPPKNTSIPALAVQHPQGRGIGGVILDFSGTACVARYVELADTAGTLVENYREEF